LPNRPEGKERRGEAETVAEDAERAPESDKVEKVEPPAEPEEPDRNVEPETEAPSEAASRGQSR
jgi:hypothetical protein